MMMHNPLHPGLVVRDALIDNTDLTVTEAAELIGVTRPTLSRLLNGKSSISPEMALRLSKFFGNSIEMWINLQAQYDVWKIRQRSDEIEVKRFNKAA